jgi:hypothetical protein
MGLLKHTYVADAELLQAVEGVVDHEGRSPSRRRGPVLRCGRGRWTGDQIAGLQPELGGDAVATAPLMHKDLRDLAPTGRGHPDGLI